MYVRNALTHRTLYPNIFRDMRVMCEVNEILFVKNISSSKI